VRVKPTVEQELNDLSKKISEKPREIPVAVDLKKIQSTNKKG
jgi:hypothetical protein